VAIVVLIFVAVVITLVTWLHFWRRSKKRAAKSLQPNATGSDDIHSIDSLLLDLSTLQVATDDFAEDKRLGEGGFGVVYKGDLPGGQEIAVKRLSKTSRQGIEELKTELLLVAKLNHKNLVRLVGVCLEKREKILVYEYMPNRSLDTFLFDTEKVKELDWSKRFKIISGIICGLQYLHEDSQLKIVHRDLKARNILLDSDYNPKISDFGLAKIFGGDQSKIVTHRIAGTYGYMSPEYAMRGQYPTKSDVFSIGVLILEIITGRRNYNTEQDDLINVTWEHWTREKAIELIDKSLSNCCPIDQFLKFMHIGLLCVQQKPADRPSMSAVNFMLSSNEVHLPPLTRPAFFLHEIETNSEPNIAGNAKQASSNEVTITELVPR
ncbi:cysteine-rich receptor-like protein kinase 6, partial [Triticum dicoccoides]|uniref:cysteine-rich receptor-like protein kinase 6 n=1 Tax=Triticum dicoccoides TaxID=85692 RepID=UPI00188F7FED